MGIIILVYPSFSEALSKLSTQWVKNPCQCEYTMFVYGRKPYLYHIIRQTTFHTSLKYVVLYILYYTLEPNFATSLLQGCHVFCLPTIMYFHTKILHTLHSKTHLWSIQTSYSNPIYWYTSMLYISGLFCDKVTKNMLLLYLHILSNIYTIYYLMIHVYMAQGLI